MTIPTLVLHPELESGVAQALSTLDGVEVQCARDTDDVIRLLGAGAPALLTHVWDERFLTPQLRWVQGQGAGYEQFPLEQFRDRGIVLTTARGAHPVAAEHAFALLLALTRGINQSLRDQQQRRWQPVGDSVELDGLTMTILGLGAIGEQIAERAYGWGMRLIGIKNDPRMHSGRVSDVRTPDQLRNAAAESDVLVVSAPALPATRHVVDAPVLEALGEGWVVNVARGSLIDESALLTWLRGPGRRGAGLDVFADEPLPVTSPLWDLPNVVITPHVAGSSNRYGTHLAPIVAANLAAFHGRRPWATRVV